MPSVLARLIERAYRSNSFVSALIYGAQGAGKTTYAVKVLYELYGSWDEALRHTYFDVKELIDDLKAAFDEGRRIKAVLLDDAAVSIHAHDYRRRHSRLFDKIFNLARSVTAGMIFTTVGLTDILKLVRNKVTHRVRVRKLSPYWSEAIIYEAYVTPLLNIVVKRRGRDRIRLGLPEDVWVKYNTMRKETLGRLFNEWEAELEEEERRLAKVTDRSLPEIPFPELDL